MNITVMVDGFCLAMTVLGAYIVSYKNRIPWRFQRDERVKHCFLTLLDRLRHSKPIRRGKEEKQEKEIYEAIAFLRNMTAIGKSDVSSDFIIQQLSEHRGILKPIYVKMLSYLRLNRKEEAAKAFYDTVGTPISKDFARLLIQWDEIAPQDLTEILLSHQKNIKEVRITNQKRRDELISDLIYLPVVVNVILIFMNFIYVAYFIDQKEMLNMFMS